MKRLRGWIIGLLVLALLPGAVLAQWSHNGNFNVNGYIGAGTANPARGIHLQGDNAIFRMDRDRDSTSFMMVRTALNDFNTIQKAFLFSVNSSGVNDGQFTISDKGAAVSGPGGTRRFTIANDGRVGVGRLSAVYAGLHVKSPAAGDMFRVDNTEGNPRFVIDANGEMFAMGNNLGIWPGTTTRSGYNLGQSSGVMNFRNAFLALNDRTAVLSSSGLDGLLRIQDADNNWTNYRFDNAALLIGHIGDISINGHKQGDGHELILTTTGEGIDFVGDSDGNTSQILAFRWYNNSRDNAGKLMDMAANGNLRVRGTVTPSVAFDLAEAYWKSEEGIEAGDVVCIDPERPNAVVLARAANDRAVVGVVSTDPGIVMGLGIFNAEQLAEAWGEEIAARFAKEQPSIQKRLAAADPYLKGRLANQARMKSALNQRRAGAEADRAREEYGAEEAEVAEALEDAALQSFFDNHFARLSMAGRVPVKVDASHGAIAIGDLLVASATPGHAMRSENPAPGTVVGKALEPLDGGQGLIMMMVLNR
jgi:hypothetical protein